MIKFKSKLGIFECPVCPTNRNCTYCKRYKKYLKKQTERMWRYGNVTRKETLKNVLITIAFAPWFLIVFVAWILDAFIYLYYKFKGDI